MSQLLTHKLSSRWPVETVESYWDMQKIPRWSTIARQVALVEQALHDALRARQVTEEPQEHPAETAPVRE